MIRIAKITAKGRTTIPHEVRAALNVKPGDFLVWDVGAEGVARVRRMQPHDLEYPRAVESTLVEWSGAEDDEAYHEL